jgi:hypothetical protein
VPLGSRCSADGKQADCDSQESVEDLHRSIRLLRRRCHSTGAPAVPDCGTKLGGFPAWDANPSVD